MSDDPQHDGPQGQPRAGSPQPDEELLEELRAAAQHLDPVPEDAVLAARSMLAHLRLDAELAELTFDSLTDAPGVAVRSQTQTVRRLTFDAGEAQVELEVVVEDDRRRLIGQCVPATEVDLTVRRRDEAGSGGTSASARTTTDALGRFVIEVPSGSISLRCVWPSSELTVETTWVRV